ncbi:DUF4240 domain-containing protein [Winogradskyella rapida]|uniref:DUF4240 domain-containing protein n=1 Tax=Winogradskyella rapida TaxID=549701 RepID=A0ABW3KQG2_9FLAO
MGIFDKLFGKKYPSFQTEGLSQNSEQLMDSQMFWEMISISKANSSGDYEQQQLELKKELLKRNATDILEFDNKFRTLRGEIYDWNFWAAAYIINGGCSDDCFSDFRGWLIGQGKAVFESAIQNVENLAELKDTNDGDWEGLSYVPSEAYEQKIGKDLPAGIRENFEITGEEWSEDGDDLKNKFPKLWEKFGLE